MNQIKPKFNRCRDIYTNSTKMGNNSEKMCGQTNKQTNRTKNSIVTGDR